MQTDFSLNPTDNSELFPSVNNFSNNQPSPFPSLSPPNTDDQNQQFSSKPPPIPLCPFPRSPHSRLVITQIPKLQGQPTESPLMSKAISARAEDPIQINSSLPLLRNSNHYEKIRPNKSSEPSPFPSMSKPAIQLRLNPTMLKGILPARRMGSQLARLPRSTINSAIVEA